MSSKKLPSNDPKRKTKPSPQASTAADCDSSGESQANEHSNQDSEDRPSKAPAASVTDPDLEHVRPTPRDRTFRFKNTVDDGVEEYAQADELNELPDEEGDSQPDNPSPNLLPKQVIPYTPGNDPDGPFDHYAPEFNGTEEAEAYWCDDTHEGDDAADVEETGGDRPRPKVTVSALMDKLREMGGVWVSSLTRPITDNGDQAIVLSQILYWFDDAKRGQPRARVFKNNRRWFYKTHEEFAEETGIPPRRVKDCLHALRDKGYIDIEHWLAEGSRTTHVAINVKTVYKAMHEALLRRKNTGRTKSVPR